MTDTMEQVAESKPQTSLQLLEKAINSHLETAKRVQAARDALKLAEDDLEVEQKNVDKAWRGAGGPTGIYQMWVFADGYKMLTLEPAGDGDPHWCHYTISELPKSLA